MCQTETDRRQKKNVPFVFQVMWEETEDRRLSSGVLWLITEPPSDADILVAQQVWSKKTSMKCQLKKKHKTKKNTVFTLCESAECEVPFSKQSLC